MAGTRCSEVEPGPERAPAARRFFCFDFVIDLVEQCATDGLLCRLDLGVHEINFRIERPD
jgi:hypothetical protein